jgi:hypothetical protein
LDYNIAANYYKCAGKHYCHSSNQKRFIHQKDHPITLNKGFDDK